MASTAVAPFVSVAKCTGGREDASDQMRVDTKLELCRFWPLGPLTASVYVHHPVSMAVF